MSDADATPTIVESSQVPAATPQADAAPADAAPADAAPAASAPAASTPAASAPARTLDLDGIERDLADVESALARLDDGAYWTDEVTGDQLPDELLAEHPTARRLADR